MQIFTGIEAFKQTPHRPLILALGHFDGLHLGHQKILQRTIEDAKERNAASAVFTFQEHPQRILRPDLPPPVPILSSDHKLFLLEQLGAEVCFFIPFTKEFSKIEADVFVREILVKHLGIQKILLGYNARFGHERKGSPALMNELAQQLKFDFEEIGPVEVQGEAVSSSRIRNLLASGYLEHAAACLGRPFSIMGEVVPGEGRGKELGFPTANLEAAQQPLLPFGVYPVRVREITKQRGSDPALWAQTPSAVYEGVLNYGLRPTFGSGSKPVLEAFLFDFKGNLYGKTLEVFFYPRLRPEKSFPGAEALKEQISRDVKAARRYFLLL